MSDAENPFPPSDGRPGGPGQKPARKPRGAEATREDRLKAALKANMARRKAQARARADRPDGIADSQSAEGHAAPGDNNENE